MRLLAPGPGERVIDWFCGLGNFTLPLATRARAVLGIEGSEACSPAPATRPRLNGLAERTRFEAANLFEVTPASAGRRSAPPTDG